MENKLEDKRAFKLLISNALLRAGRLVFQLFLNIYIWKQTDWNVRLLALFNLVYLTVHVFSFVYFARVIKDYLKRNYVHLVSMFWYIVIYLFVAFLWRGAIDHVVLIGILIWIFNGMYWINYHNSYFEFTNFGNRWNFEWLKRALTILNKIIVPSVVWWIIGLNYFWLGYELAFWLGALLFLLSWIIWVVQFDDRDKEEFCFLDTFKKCIRDEDIFRSLYTYSLTWFSFSNTLLEVIIPVIIFSYIWKEMELGFVVSMFSVVSMFWAYLFWKFVPYSKYRFSIIVSWFLYAFSLLWFVSFSSLNYMVLFSAMFNFFLIFFSMPQKVISDSVLYKLEDYKNRRSEYMVVRELFLSFWWIFNFWIIYFIGSFSSSHLKYLFYAMIVLTFISIYSLSKIKLEEIRVRD